MNEKAHHPDLAQLLDFVNGHLNETDSSAIEEHLQHCPLCEQTLADSPQDDALLKLARVAAKGEHPSPKESFLHPGDLIGEYEILEELGRGGMGSVYRAFDPHLKRDVALKLIPSGRHQEYYRRLRLEAETTARFQHPGIVRIYHIGECPHGLYLVLELLHPGGLYAIEGIRQHSPDWIAALLQQLAETIEFAHREGIVHRDLKPDNILLAPATDSVHPWDSLDTLPGGIRLPRIKITDFGLAKCLDEDNSMTRTGIMLGTPGYMSPEQLPDSGEAVGPGSDIYALGVILYQLLSGHLPFESPSLAKTMRMVRDDDPPPLRSLNPAVPKDLETICQTCLMKQPAKRYPSAQALADDLARFLRNEPIEARPLNLFQRLYSQARRRPLLASHLTGALFLYSTHLFARYILEAPLNQGFFHTYLSLVLMTWLISIAYIQRMLESSRRRRAGEYLYAVLVAALGFLGLMGDAGPSSAPVNLYLFLIITAPFIRPHPHMIWFQTATATLSYLALTAATWYWRPGNLLNPEHALIFVLGLPVMGGAIHLLLRRISLNP